MAGKLDWNKIGVIATCASFALGVLSYFRPADPVHPTRFDFLSKTVLIPLWLAVVLLIAIPAITAMIVRKISQRSLTQTTDMPSTIPENHRSSILSFGKPKATLSAARASHAQQVVQPNSDGSFHFNSAIKTFTFTFDEGLAYEIDANQIGAGGATVAVFNNRPEHIALYRVDVSEINSWSERHGTFLPPYRFNRKAVIDGQNLDAMHKTSAQWLIRVVEKDGKRYLTVFNDHTTPLSWPNNDKSTVEIWRLTLVGRYSVKPIGSQGLWQPLPPAFVLVRWDRENGTFCITRYEPDQ